MPSHAIIGAQFGDEGKGKITDFFAEKAHLVARYQGGNNAGHTVVVGAQTYKFHLLPSGMLRGKHCVLGAGTVINPEVLLQELEQIKESVKNPRLTLDLRAHVILPYHAFLDEMKEGKKGGIGTTKRGIGPTYAEKAERTGIRIADLLDPERLEKKLLSLVPYRQKILFALFGCQLPRTAESLGQEFVEYGRRLKPFVGDVSAIVRDALARKKHVIFESAQGTFLDNDFGTYPYVTSSHPLSGGIYTGVGLPAQKIDRLTGVAKAYTTRVGEGPFVTELSGKEADRLRKKGNEFGTTTGRPRRVGWLDLVLLRSSQALNGFTDFGLTKLDVLSGFGKIKVCTHYVHDGRKLREAPVDTEAWDECEPAYRELKGFTITGKEKRFSELEKEAQAYVKFVEKETRVLVKLISIGVERQQTIVR